MGWWYKIRTRYELCPSVNDPELFVTNDNRPQNKFAPRTLLLQLAMMIFSVIVILLLTKIDGFSIQCGSPLNNKLRETASFNLLYSSTVNGEDSNISHDGTVDTSINVDQEELQGKTSDDEEVISDVKDLSTESEYETIENQTVTCNEPTLIDNENKKVNSTIDEASEISSSAPLTFQKYLTMQV